MTMRCIAIVCFAIGALAGCTGPNEPVITIPTGPPEVAVTSPAPAPPGVPAWTFGNGTPRVFREIAPGVYRTGGSTTPDWPMCTWKIHKGDRIISSGTATGPTTITVEPVHDAVESKNCLVWRRVGDVP